MENSYILKTVNDDIFILNPDDVKKLYHYYNVKSIEGILLNLDDNYLKLDNAIIMKKAISYIKKITGNEPNIKKCKFCNNYFTYTRTSQIYCGKKCRENHHYHKNKDGN